MIPVLSSEEMKRADSATIEGAGLSGDVLMERAALALFDVIKDIEGLERKAVLIVCGPGNNGGDGLAFARILSERDILPDVVLLGDKRSDDNKKQQELLKKIYPEVEIYDAIPGRAYDIIVDAMFGISLKRPLEGIFKEAAERICAMRSTGSFVVAADIPSGVDASTGQIQGAAVGADITVTFGAFKTGQLLYPGAMHAGKVVLKDIGIPASFMEKEAGIHILHDSEICLPPRLPYTNKGSYGKVLVVAGSKGMAGAAVLCAEAVLRSGSGMVRVYTEESNRQIVQTSLPEAIVTTYKDKMDAKALQDAMDWCDAVAIGPGLSRSDTARDILEYTLKNGDMPMVLDADAINLIASEAELLSSSSADIIITPHLKEMERLAGIEASEIAGHLISTASDFSKSYNVTCVLKDARTVITSGRGDVIININGNNGMATAGSGDVLTGIIASVRGRMGDSFVAAAIGCAVHGKAGDMARDALGADHMIAGDIIRYIG